MHEKREDEERRPERWRTLATALIGTLLGMFVTGMILVWQRIESIGQAFHELARSQAADNATDKAERDELRRRLEKVEKNEEKERH